MASRHQNRAKVAAADELFNADIPGNQVLCEEAADLY